ncbi:MAG: hypothetical protein ACI4P0_00715 [Mailhella sp.]
MRTHTFKPFEKVLWREGTDIPWSAGFYSHMGVDVHFIIGGPSIDDGIFLDDFLIPYEGNEHLLGCGASDDEETL